ncbi:MAG: GGDEF domain-containing protein, partial [Oscillospiraceae bacterium]
FGYSDQDCADMRMGRHPYPLSAPGSAALLGDDFLAAIRRTEGFSVTLRLSGGAWGRLTGVPSRREDGEDIYHCTLTDITAEQQLCLTLQEQMELDSLTDTFNRGALVRRIDAFFAASPHAPATFLTLDVDNFKQINDSMGHLRGDEALRQVAAAVRATLEPSDMLARMGGDEFAVFFPGALSEDTLRQRFAALQAALQVKGLSVSIGVCHAPEDGSDYASLYRCADTALLLAKQTGKDRVQCFAAIDGADSARLKPLLRGDPFAGLHGGGRLS